jgi:hypothetical protein
MCAYLHRLGDYESSKLILLVNLVPSSALSGHLERIPAQLEAVMHKWFILLLGVFLGSRVLTAAQTPALELVPAQELVASIVTAAPAPLHAVSFLLPENPGKPAHFSYLFAGAYERDQGLESLASLSPMREVKTLFLTQSLLPLVQIWGGRLRLDGFISTLHMQNVELGPSAAGGLQDSRLLRQGYPRGPRSVDLYGVSLNFHFGPDAQIGHPAQIWRCVARIVGRRKGCSE